MANFEIGSLISFTYPVSLPHDKRRPRNKDETRAHDKFPEVLVLHPNWQGLVHGLNFKYLSEDEINTVRMILDPMFEMNYREALQKKNANAYAELDRILTGKVEGAVGPHSRIVKITSPRGFYLNIIRPFIITRSWDPYRLYRVEKMTNVRIVQTASHMTGKDALAKYKAQQSQVVQKLGNKPQSQIPDKGALQWFKDKFQHMRGPKLPTFSKPGALPGTRDDEGEEG